MSEEEAVTTETWDQTRQFRDELSAANRREGELKEQLRVAHEDAANAKKDEDDLSDYDVLVDKVKSISTELASSKQESEALKGDLQKIQSRSKAEQGTRLLNDEVASLEGEFGKTHTNEILEKVNAEYLEFDVASMPDKPRQAWIKKNLRLAYIESKNAAEPDKTSEKTPESTVDTGTGGSPPSDEIPEGTFAEVSKAMLERDKKHGK